MIRSNGKNNAPYALLSAALLGCACFFAAMLWQGGNARTPRANLADYVPNFAVQADVVRVVRVVPLAGRSLRSPCADADAQAAEAAQ